MGLAGCPGRSRGQPSLRPGADHLPYIGDTEPILAAAQEFLTGVRPAPVSERLLATVLFTDVVRSPEHAAELGDRRWVALLQAHRVLVRQEIGRWRGEEIDTAGDGFLITFDGPARAIRCAQAILTAAAEQGLQVRAGLRTGEIERRGSQIGGIAVHIAARVTASAEPGEVLVSSTVRDLVAGSGIRFEDRGTHRLKGVPDPWRLFGAEGKTDLARFETVEGARVDECGGLETGRYCRFPPQTAPLARCRLLHCHAGGRCKPQRKPQARSY